MLILRASPARVNTGGFWGEPEGDFAVDVLTSGLHISKIEHIF